MQFQTCSALPFSVVLKAYYFNSSLDNNVCGMWQLIKNQHNIFFKKCYLKWKVRHCFHFQSSICNSLKTVRELHAVLLFAIFHYEKVMLADTIATHHVVCLDCQAV